MDAADAAVAEYGIVDHQLMLGQQSRDAELPVIGVENEPPRDSIEAIEQQRLIEVQLEIADSQTARQQRRETNDEADVAVTERVLDVGDEGAHHGVLAKASLVLPTARILVLRQDVRHGRLSVHRLHTRREERPIVALATQQKWCCLVFLQNLNCDRSRQFVDVVVEKDVFNDDDIIYRQARGFFDDLPRPVESKLSIDVAHIARVAPDTFGSLFELRDANIPTQRNCVHLIVLVDRYEHDGDFAVFVGIGCALAHPKYGEVDSPGVQLTVDSPCIAAIGNAELRALPLSLRSKWLQILREEPRLARARCGPSAGALNLHLGRGNTSEPQDRRADVRQRDQPADREHPRLWYRARSPRLRLTVSGRRGEQRQSGPTPDAACHWRSAS